MKRVWVIVFADIRMQYVQRCLENFVSEQNKELKKLRIRNGLHNPTFDLRRCTRDFCQTFSMGLRWGKFPDPIGIF